MHPDARRTLELLRLKTANQLVLIPDTETHRGMLRRVNPYVAWGEPNLETVKEILKRQDARLLERLLASLKLGGIEELAEKLVTGNVDPALLKRLGVTLSVRLRPPRRGFGGSIKRPYAAKGVYGMRGQDIDGVIRRML